MVNVNLGKMSSNCNSSSSSIKFAPLRVADFMKDILILRDTKCVGSANSSYSSLDSSTDSVTETNLKTTEDCNNVESDSESDKIQLRPGKENIGISKPIERYAAIENELAKVQKSDNLNSHSVAPLVNEVVKRNGKAFSENKQVILSNITNRNTSKVVDNLPSILSQTKLKINDNRVSWKVKTVTPNVKVGIKKHTPSCNSHSARKLRQKSSRESPMCPAGTRSAKRLFPEWLGKCAPETPVQKMPAPIPSATPSLPQGLPGTHKSLKTISVKGKNYVVVKKIGEGGSSQVFKVLDMGGRSEYAVKVVGLGVESSMAEGYINEIRLLRKLQNSDRVVTMHNYEYYTNPRSLRVLLELGETDLATVLRSHAGVPTQPLTLLLHYWTEMLAAVRHIHEHEIIHADLKPANFLLVGGRLKLIDFGIATHVDSDATSVQRSAVQGTFSYMSPEALEGGAGMAGGASMQTAPIKISYRSDVWSLGIILYSMVYGRTPFGHIINRSAKMAAIINPNHQIAYPDASHVPYTIMRAIRQCLRYNARARPTVAELQALPYCPAAPPAPARALLARLRSHVSSDEWRLLQDTCGLPPMLPCDEEGLN